MPPPLQPRPAPQPGTSMSLPRGARGRVRGHGESRVLGPPSRVCFPGRQAADPTDLPREKACDRGTPKAEVSGQDHLPKVRGALGLIGHKTT